MAYVKTVDGKKMRVGKIVALAKIHGFPSLAQASFIKKRVSILSVASRTMSASKTSDSALSGENS